VRAMHKTTLTSAMTLFFVGFTTLTATAQSVHRIFKVPVAPQDRPWMWASGHSATTVKRAAHGYEPMREAAMAAFAKSWQRE
jgi:hypothetical protein